MITFEKIEEKDYNDLTAIMKTAFDDDTQLHTSLKEDGACGFQKVGENQYEDGAKSFIFFKRVKKSIKA